MKLQKLTPRQIKQLIKDHREPVWSFLIKVFGTGCTFIFSILLGRTLGSSAVGTYSIGSDILTIALILAKFGLDTALIKFISIYYHSKYPGDIRRIMKHSAATVCLISLILITAIFPLAPWLADHLFHMPDLDHLLRFLIFSTPFIALLHLIASFFKGLGNTKLGLFFESAILPFVSSLFLLLVRLIAGHSDFDLLGLLYLTAAVCSFLIAGLSFLVRLHSVRHQDSPDYDFKQVLQTAHPLLWVNSTNYILSCADTIMLGLWCSSSDVGVYNVATKITLLFSMLLSVVNALFGPRFALLYHEGKLTELRQHLRSISWKMRALSAGLVLLLALASPLILSLWGGSFLRGEPVLLVALVGQFFVLSKGPLATLLMMCGLEKQHRNNTLISAALNILLNACLIPWLGILGAAIATSASLVVKNVLTIRVSRRLFTK